MNLIAKYFAAWEDRRLVGRFLHYREEQVFREIYRRHSSKLYQLALRLAGSDAHAAEEILQETWVRALAHLPAFRWQSSLRTWLSAITINCCRELFRVRAQQRRSHLAEELDLAASLDETQRLDLESAIAALPPGYRQVFVLYEIEGYSHEEIGRMLEIEIGTSKSQLSRSRRALRQALEFAVAENQNRKKT